MSLAEEIINAGMNTRKQIMGEPMQQLQQVGALQGILVNAQKAQMQQQEIAHTQQLRGLMAQSGGDVEKAISVALQSGNVKAAHDLGPLLKIQQEAKTRKETAEGIGALYGGGQPQQLAGPADGTQPDADPRRARLQRMAQLYANNPTVMKQVESEIAKLDAGAKPIVEHNFSVGDNQVQPHISLDGGKTWKPLEGSKPSAKFARQVVNVNTGGGGHDAGTLTDDTKAMDAWRYLTDGTLPPNMGRGIQGTKQATEIRNEASRLAKDMGMSPDEIRMGQLTNKTQVQAIGQLAKAKAQILQFEKTAMANADLALKASADVWRTDSPWFNKPMQAIQQGGASDPKLAVFNAANETFISEYARVMSGGYGAAQTTEGAQQRAHTLLNKAMSAQTYSVVVGQLKTEMRNREKALNDQMGEERNNLRRGITRKPDAEVKPPGEDVGAQVKAAGIDYEPDKYEYRVTNGKVQRKAK